MAQAPFPPQSGIILTRASVTLQASAVLRDITLDLQSNRIGIIGRNGSGKSTLLRLMAGLIAPTSGTVRLAGFDPAKNRKAALGQIGILFQNPDHQILFPTVLEELSFGLTQQGLPRAAAEAAATAALQSEGRSAWRDRPCHQLSQGQRHFLCLLSVLLMQPHTILLDEPLAGLDLPTQARLTRRFAALPQRLITISHDPATMRACDRVIWLDGGTVRREGPAAPILAAFEAEMERIGEQDADTDIPG